MNFNTSLLVTEPLELGKNCYIIGTATKGKSNEPIKVSSIEEATKTFGSVENNSVITKLYSQYFNSGGKEAYLVRLSGTTATCSIPINNVETIVLETKLAGTFGNSYYVLTNSRGMTLFINDYTTTLLYEDFPTTQELCNGISRSTNIEAYCIVEDLETIDIENNQYLFTGGEDGINLTKNELYNKLKITLDILYGRQIDIILLANMYFDDTKPTYYIDTLVYGNTYYNTNKDYLDIGLSKYNYHKLLIDFCMKQTNIGIMTHAIMGFNPISSEVDTDYDTVTMITEATAIKTAEGIREYIGGSWYDYGRYLSLCYGDIIYLENTDYEYIDNWYATYAANYINSGYDKSLTRDTIVGGVVNTNLSDDTIQKLTDLGIVTYTYSPINKWCITAGITTALNTNAMYIVSNVKVVQRCIAMLGYDIAKYIDKPIEPLVTKRGITKVVDESLNKRVNNDKILKDYNYTVTYNSSVDTITINIDLYTFDTIEAISATTSIRLQE